MLLATMYSGIIIASNGIIIVAIIAIKTSSRDLNLNFASPYPHNDDRTTVVTAHVIATISELIRFLINILFPLFPRTAFTKFVKKLRSSVLKNDFDGIHLNGIARICRASINDAVIIEAIGITVNRKTKIRIIQAMISPNPTRPTYLFVFIFVLLSIPRHLIWRI